MLAVAGAALALLAGDPAVPLGDVVRVLGGRRVDDLTLVVVRDLRLPRLLLALLSGAALALAGALLQDALRNPLASPELLGVSSGAALVTAVVAVLGLAVPRALLTPLACAGGLAVGVLVVALAARRADTVTVVLVGVAASSTLGGCIVAVLALGSTADSALFFQYLLGSLANRGWDDVRLVAPWVAVALPVVLLLHRSLDVLRLGDAAAAALGARVGALRTGVLVLAGLLTSAVVACCGPIGFVALLAAHLVRGVLGTARAATVLPLSAATGATLLLLADSVGRFLTAPREVPVGVWTVLVGGPALLAVLRSRRTEQLL